MAIGTIGYLIFLATLALMFHMTRIKFVRQTMLISGGLALLLSQAESLLPLMPTLAFVLSSFFSAVLVTRYPSMALRMALCFFLMLTFLLLKQYWFVPEWTPFRILVTIGMSYILMRALHVVLEAGDAFDVRLEDLGCYLRFQVNPFSLLSGPINRFDDFTEDDHCLHTVTLTHEVVGSVLLRLSFGLLKLMLLAPLANYYFASLPAAYGTVAIPPAAALFILYIYWNFSGTMDMVISAARLFGYHLPENFDRPWMASSFVEFWSRWHITLSNFLRDTIFFPMLKCLADRGIKRTGLLIGNIVAGFLAFVVMGLWHGTTYMFFWLGVLLALGVTVNRLWQMIMPSLPEGRFNVLWHHLAGASAWLYFGLAAMTVWPSVQDLDSYGRILTSMFSLPGLFGMLITLVALVFWRAVTQFYDALPKMSGRTLVIARQMVIVVNWSVIYLLFKSAAKGISTFNYYANIT